MPVPEMNWKHLLALLLVTLAYVVLGGVVFSHIELDNENRIKTALRDGLRTFLANHSCVSLNDINNLFLLVGDDVKLARISVYNKTTISMWDVAGASVFAVTVVTTIGYGNLAPRTSIGQAVCVVYALFGIPLMMFLLKDIGEKLFSVAYKLYQFRYFKNKENQQKIFNGILLCLLSFTIIIGLPGYLFSYLENWTLGQAFYYCFITLTTIGFGDFIAAESYNPKAPTGTAGRFYRWFVFIWIILGLSFLSLVISLLSKVMVSKVRSMEQYTSEKIENEVHKIQEELTNVKNKYIGDSKRISFEKTEPDGSGVETKSQGATLISVSVTNKPRGVVDNDSVTADSSVIELETSLTDYHCCIIKTESGSVTVGDCPWEIGKTCPKHGSLANSHCDAGKTDTGSASLVDSHCKIGKTNSGSVSLADTQCDMGKTDFRSEPLTESYCCVGKIDCGGGSFIDCHCGIGKKDFRSAESREQCSSAQLQEITNTSISGTREKCDYKNESSLSDSRNNNKLNSAGQNQSTNL
ncbi:potassium channel subfamily K member 2-like [Gigantopelta aegis]|uniref:potassium channel subfamily K member 2-like n=1 Tax=Gigantopelta aegis TaxID=1735272 RepID=UPI001B8875FC|nr:potassium channel subfamily K member 2-like [Gigantopelta aegis]XP_041353404.1 potassium channel subfamily K member 2-like [Gigantopelta aegis]